MTARIGLPVVLLGLLIAGAAWSQTLFENGFEVAPLVTHRIVVEPGARLFTQTDETATLTVRVLDASDQEVAAPVTFQSSAPEVVRVDTDGNLTAISAVGSATITVSSPGALDALVMVAIAAPVASALLIADEQVVAGPAAVDPQATLALGVELVALISGIDVPAAGTILIGTGALPIGGRVVRASAVAGGVEVVFAVVPLSELFASYAINEQLDLSSAPIDLDPDVAALFDLVRREDGSLTLQAKPTAKGVAPPMLSPPRLCSTNTPELNNIVTLNVGTAINVSPQLNLDIVDGTSGNQRFVLNGSATASFDFMPRVTASFAGMVKCKLKLGSFNIPILGSFSVLLGGKVDVGIGLEFGGAATLAEPLGYDVTVTAQGSFSAGFDCASGCETLGDVDASADGDFRLVLPNSFDELITGGRLQANVRGFFFADVGIGNPIIEALQFKPLEITAGVRQSLDVQSALVQADNPAYASDFKLELVGTAGTTSEILDVAQLFGVTLPPLTFELATPLAQSPQGTITITDPNGGSSANPENPPRVQVGTDAMLGEMATFDITLNPATYLGAYVVSEVQLLERVDDGMGGQMLRFPRPLCGLFNPTPGQTQFSCQTDFLEAGAKTFFLFVKASLFGIELPFLFEAGNNTSKTLVVSDGVAGLVEVARGTNVRGVDMSADGATVIGHFFQPLPSDFDCAATGRCGFRWTAATGVTPIDPGASSFQEVLPNAVSADGSTIVGAFINTADDIFAFRQSSTVGFDLLPGIGGDNNQARGVSGDGSIAVGFVDTNDATERRAVRWVDGQLIELGAFGEAQVALAEAISASGSPIVGNSSGQGAFSWTATGGYSALALGESAGVAAISGDGSTIVGNRQVSFDDPITGFVLRGGVVTNLGLAGAGFSAATDASTDGSVVVGFSDIPVAKGGVGTPPQRIGWRRTAETGVQTLTQWLESTGRSLPRLRSSLPIAVSGDGRTILAELEFEPGEEVEGAGLYLVTER